MLQALTWPDFSLIWIPSIYIVQNIDRCQKFVAHYFYWLRNANGSVKEGFLVLQQHPLLLHSWDQFWSASFSAGCHLCAQSLHSKGKFLIYHKICRFLGFKFVVPLTRFCNVAGGILRGGRCSTSLCLFLMHC